MTFWDVLYRLGPGWPNARGWYAIALFVQTGVILWMIAAFPALRTDEFFKSIATAIVITGWIGFAVGLRDPAKDREQIAALITRLPHAQSSPDRGDPSQEPA